jgi:Amt family ammonium transporter
MNQIEQESLDAAIASVNGDMSALWIILCAILVFFMQAGFTLVEVGFSRAKNAGNIIMKNIMDLAIGSVMFLAVGYAFMYGDTVVAGGFMRLSSSEQGYFFFHAGLVQFILPDRFLCNGSHHRFRSSCWKN